MSALTPQEHSLEHRKTKDKKKKQNRRQISQNQLPQPTTLLPRKATEHRRRLMESYNTFTAIIYMKTCLPVLNKLETLIWKSGREGKEKKKNDKTAGTLVGWLNWNLPVHRGGARET